jgi:uncharacterized membrane protein
MVRFDRHSRRWLALITVFAMAFCFGFVLAPRLEHGSSSVGSWLRLAYSPACHQMPARCLDTGFGPWAVCSRCAGLYAGGLAGLLFAVVSGRRIRARLSLVALSLVPSVADFVIAFSGLPSLPNWPRFAIATIPGAMVGLLLSDAVADIVSKVGQTAPSK